MAPTQRLHEALEVAVSGRLVVGHAAPQLGGRGVLQRALALADVGRQVALGGADEGPGDLLAQQPGAGRLRVVKGDLGRRVTTMLRGQRGDVVGPRQPEQAVDQRGVGAGVATEERDAILGSDQAAQALDDGDRVQQRAAASRGRPASA